MPAAHIVPKSKRSFMKYEKIKEVFFSMRAQSPQTPIMQTYSDVAEEFFMTADHIRWVVSQTQTRP